MSGLFQDNEARGFAQKGIAKISAWGKAVGMLAGALAINVLDVTIGGLAIYLLLQDINFMFGPPYDGIMVGFTASLSLLFIQLVLWDTVLLGGIQWADAFKIVFGGFILFLDSNLDISPISGWTETSKVIAEWRELQSPIPFWNTLADMVIFSVNYAIYAVLAVGEYFTALYIRTFRPIKNFKKKGKLNRKTAPSRSSRRSPGKGSKTELISKDPRLNYRKARIPEPTYEPLAAR